MVSSSLTYTDAVNNPATYSITWVTGGFDAVINQPLPAGNIPFNVSEQAAAGSYNGILTIQNAAGCSTSINFSIKINPKPAAPHVMVHPTSQY